MFKKKKDIKLTKHTNVTQTLSKYQNTDIQILFTCFSPTGMLYLQILVSLFIEIVTDDYSDKSNVSMLISKTNQKQQSDRIKRALLRSEAWGTCVARIARWRQTRLKPWLCSMACSSFSRSDSLLVYLGRSSRLKHVCATGKYCSPPPVGWITNARLFIPMMGIRSLPVRNTEEKWQEDASKYVQTDSDSEELHLATH